MRIFNALLIWVLILVLAFLNGGLRELVLVPFLGRPYALVLSGVILSASILAVAFLTLAKIRPRSNHEALGIGTFWVLLTLAFEFGFGRFVQNKPWSELLEAYAFKDGNIWPVVLLVTIFAPLVAKRYGSRGPRRDANYS